MPILRRAAVLVVLLVSTFSVAQAPNAAPAGKPHETPFAGLEKAPQCADHHEFHSAALDRDMAYCVELPAVYSSSKESYPVLYLLHGLWGDENDWLGKTKLSEYARRLKLIVVMPEGDDAWYTNSVIEPRNRYEDYIAMDLIREIEGKYRVKSGRATRFIAGLSMGGYGALKMGLKHSDLFSFVGAFSAAALNADPRSRTFETFKLAMSTPDGDPIQANNLYALAGQADPAKLPYFMITCGTSDGLRVDDLQMADLMRVLNIPYEYSEFPGKHEWPVWNRSVGMALLWLQKAGMVESAVAQQ